MKLFAVQVERSWMGRLQRGDDLLAALGEFCDSHAVRAGQVWAIGALEQARLGYYDQQAGEYRILELPGAQEIASLSGNVSEKDGRPFAHLHAVLADRQGRCRGGHVMEGCRVFACEFAVMQLSGELPRRTHDAATGLALW